MLTAVPLSAHDFWLGASNWFPEPGSTFAISAGVGERFPTRLDFKTPANWFDDWRIIGPSGDVPVSREFERRDLAMVADVSVPVAGAFLAVMRVAPRTIDMKADEFNDYLKEEGLEAIAALRARRNETGASAHEIFSRCAKSLVLSGRPGEAQADHTLGFTLELVAEQNPYAIRAGEELPVRLTYQNRPLPNALVVAMNRLNPDQKLRVRTGKDGRARFSLPPGGMWLIKAVHMVPAPAGSNADWASFWASLTFEPRTSNLATTR